VPQKKGSLRQKTVCRNLPNSNDLETNAISFDYNHEFSTVPVIRLILLSIWDILHLEIAWAKSVLIKNSFGHRPSNYIILPVVAQLTKLFFNRWEPLPVHTDQNYRKWLSLIEYQTNYTPHPPRIVRLYSMKQGPGQIKNGVRRRSRWPSPEQGRDAA